jgi:hypothetical protein
VARGVSMNAGDYGLRPANRGVCLIQVSDGVWPKASFTVAWGIAPGLGWISNAWLKAILTRGHLLRHKQWNLNPKHILRYSQCHIVLETIYIPLETSSFDDVLPGYECKLPPLREV